MRRAILYSVMMLILLAPLAAFAAQYYASIAAAHSEARVERIISKEVSAFLSSVSKDVERAAKISAYTAVVAGINEVVSSGAPMADSQAGLAELAWNGTYKGVGNPLAVNSSLSSWAGRIVSKYRRKNFAVTVTVVNVSVVPDGPYSLRFTTAIMVNASSDTYSINFSRLYSKESSINLVGFEDPLYTINTRGAIPRALKVNSTPVCGVAALDAAALAGVYVPSDEGPGFLDRLEGRLNQSSAYRAAAVSLPAGFETIVDTNSLAGQSFYVRGNQSVIDYEYFNSTDISGKPVNQSSLQWLKLDAPHAARYCVNITG